MKDNDVRLNETVSPKTPGGISKALLTPIRRLGLSRKWKKSGGSPFVSPLASTAPKSAESVDEVKEKSRKRKLYVDDENVNSSPPNSEKSYECNIVSTPTSAKDRSASKVSIIRKKSKIISYNEGHNACTSEQTRDPVTLLGKSEDSLYISPQIEEIDEPLVNKKSNNNFLIKNTSQIAKKDQEYMIEECVKEMNSDKLYETNNVKELKGPNNLIKECIGVIQNKITQQANGAKKLNKKSQFASDSDSDDIPLGYIYNKEMSNNEDDNDFATTSSKFLPKVQPVKKTISISNRKSTNSSKKKNPPGKFLENEKIQVAQATQSSNSFDDDDDDDDFEVNKKIVLSLKSSNKVVKPIKAKSTGSITQKDIDELKAKIEMKKKLLLAKAMTKDTEELRGLIKKWQKGCQDALLELLELMKKKLPDRTNMDNSYILQMLKIPHSLVGYDADNDCFNTPNDNSILTATFNDL